MAWIGKPHEPLGIRGEPPAAAAASRRAVLLGLGIWVIDRTIGSGSESTSLAQGAAPPALPARSNRALVSPFIGRARFVGGERERAQLARAIDDLVAKMNVFARGIARDRLTETNPIANRISFAASDTALTVRFDERAFTGPLDGGPAKVIAISGDPMEMRYRFSESRVRQWIAGDEKGQINTFTLEERRITQSVRVYASQLPEDLLYTLTYEKES